MAFAWWFSGGQPRTLGHEYELDNVGKWIGLDVVTFWGRELNFPGLRKGPWEPQQVPRHHWLNAYTSGTWSSPH